MDLVSNIDTSNLGSVSGRSTKQSAINQQIMGIIQNQDYFLQQARTHFRRFDLSALSDDSACLESIAGKDFVAIMTMMFLHVQNELCLYKQLKPYDTLFELSDDSRELKLVRSSQAHHDAFSKNKRNKNDLSGTSRDPVTFFAKISSSAKKKDKGFEEVKKPEE